MMDHFERVLETWNSVGDPNKYGYTNWTLEEPYWDPFWFEKWDMMGLKAKMIGLKKGMFLLSIVYVLVVYLGPKIMKNREPIILPKTLAGWNFFIAGISILGLYRSAFDYLKIWIHGGHYEALCLK